MEHENRTLNDKLNNQIKEVDIVKDKNCLLDKKIGNVDEHNGGKQEHP